MAKNVRTAFTYTANVPPMAVGPQWDPNAIQFDGGSNIMWVAEGPPRAFGPQYTNFGQEPPKTLWEELRLPLAFMIGAPLFLWLMDRERKSAIRGF